MSDGFLAPERAQTIRDAVASDPTFFMSEGWCEDHGVTMSECLTFLDYAVRLADMYEWRLHNAGVASVQTTLTFAKHTAKVTDDVETWTCYAPVEDTLGILSVAGAGRLVATLTPEDMPTDVGVFDTETGEVL